MGKSIELTMSGESQGIRVIKEPTIKTLDDVGGRLIDQDKFSFVKPTKQIHFGERVLESAVIRPRIESSSTLFRRPENNPCVRRDKKNSIETMQRPLMKHMIHMRTALENRYKRLL